MTPIEEASLRAQQVREQAKDAVDRNIVWEAEHGLAADGDADADGEDDPDYVDGIFVGNGKVDDSGVDFTVPVGIRMDDGEIKPLPVEPPRTRSKTKQSAPGNAMEVDRAASVEAYFGGVSEDVPLRAGALVRNMFILVFSGLTCGHRAQTTQICWNSHKLS